MIGTSELLIILLIILILFGHKRLPELARSLGEAIREFRKFEKKGEQSK
ncbi:MAG: twin-arginine translocase TatA/TatE family subunit [Candidatus Altiarchaeales archaeon]|nr:MAG: twin-arginine translocase TatA/TatE family subunit [Candidatus Altiarchaeales archaeon]